MSTVLRVELARLLHARRVLVLPLLAVLAPTLLAVVLAAADAAPTDTLFGRQVHATGFALPLLVLGYAGTWVLPVIAGLVAAEVVTTEDLHGTWPLLLTRSRGLGEVFAGKAAAAAVVALGTTVLAALASVVAGVLTAGTAPLVGLSGAQLPAGRALLVGLGSWAVVLAPMLAFTALGLLCCVAARRTLLGVLGPAAVGVVLQLLAFLPVVDPVRRLLPTAPFAAWHGLARTDVDVRPLASGLAVSAVVTVVCLAGAWAVLRARDLTEDG